ncbi:MAG: hypothetical protein V4493_02815 [Pseudomonadota bacterium]
MFSDIDNAQDKQNDVSGRKQSVTNAQLHGCAFKGWQCFHCGEIFETVGGAQDHFGANPQAKPGCMIKVELGAERGLLMALRKAEDDLAKAWFKIGNESSESAIAYQSMVSRHQNQMRQAEELGYSRGLADGAKQLP